MNPCTVTINGGGGRTEKGDVDYVYMRKEAANQ